MNLFLRILFSALLLISNIVYADIQSQAAITPANQLEQAIRGGQIDTIRQYIEKGVDINQAFEQGITPLHVAVINNQEAIVTLLINAGAQIQAADETTGATPLHLAAAYGRENIMKLLLNKGADKDCAMKFGLTPLLLAAQFGQSQVVQVLIEKKTNINHTDEEGFSALHFAAQNGNEVIARLLINHGANPGLPDRNNATPLQIATTHKHVGMVQLLAPLEKTP
jgi:ankyrin